MTQPNISFSDSIPAVHARRYAPSGRQEFVLRDVTALPGAMKLRRVNIGCLLMAALLWPVCAQASYHFHNARLDWFGADFIGWVRVEQDLMDQAPSPGQSRVKLRVIEQVKGEAMESLQLVYIDPLVGDPKRDVIVLVPAGDQQSWKEDVGKEFFVYLGRGSGDEFVAVAGHYFQIEGGAVWHLPREYSDHYQVSESPRISTFVAKVRSKRPDAAVRIGQPFLESPLRRGFRRVEAPHECVARFKQALLGPQPREAEQILYRTKSYRTADGLTRPLVDSARKNLEKIKVVGEAVSADHAVVLISVEGESGEPEMWYLLREKTRWRLLNIFENRTDEERNELRDLKEADEFRILEISLRKQRTRR